MNANDVADEISEIVKAMASMNEEERKSYYQTLIAVNVIPFDISCSLAQDPVAFGYLGRGGRINKTAQFTGEPLKLGKRTIVPKGIVGEVVGDEHGRIVLKTELGYLGWIDPNEFRILDVSVTKEFDTLH